MELEFLKNEKDEIKLRVENEDSTFFAALKDELWNTKGTDASVLNKKHPLVGKPELLVQGKDVKKILKTAAQRLKKEVEDFEKGILKI